MQLLENVYIYFVVYILLAQGHATIFVMPVLPVHLNECIWLWKKGRIHQSATTSGRIPDIFV